ncbi:ABC transporter substrate-binding protein [Bacillus sp. TS-2]|nr:ABC transporter substrate-binding protein [Bacillus sp. TS-2]
MNSSKWIWKLAILFLVILLAACGNNEQTDSEPTGTGGEGNGNGSESDEPFELSIMATLHTPEIPNDRLHDLLEEATNTELEIQWVPDSNYEERLNTAFATGTLPQAVGMGFNMFTQFKEAIRDDQFWEIGPYLDEFENLSKLKPEILENTMVDGKIYSLYQGRPLSRQGVIYRKDWADNLGLGEPKTTDDIFEMARAFTEDDPDGNGNNDTMGLTDRSDLVYGAFKTIASWFGTPNEWGFEGDELQPEFMFPEYKEAMDFMKDMHSNNYMNQDFPVTSKDDQQAMFKNGTAGIYIGSLPDVQSIYNDASDLNPDIEFDVANQIQGPDGEYGIWAIPGFGSVVLFPKSSIETEDELRSVLQFYDHLMTTEVANMLIWGIEGEHYTVEDGMALANEENRNKIDTEIRPFLSLEVGEPDTSGRYEAKSNYEVKSKADELVKDNENYLIHDPTVPLDSDTFIRSSESLKQIMDDATYKYILGQIDEAGFDAAIDNWKNSGGQAVIDEYNESYKALQ